MQLFALARRLCVNPQAMNQVTTATLSKFGAPALTMTYDHGIRMRLLASGETYRSHSFALQRLGIDVDTWPTPPAGLFIVEERMMLIRRQSSMTIAHEFGHAIDCTLGAGIYRSSLDPLLYAAFTNARNWITPYAATRIDEYFAEGMRAYVEANDKSSQWPRATRERLRACDAALYAYVDELFTNEFRLPASESQAPRINLSYVPSI